MFQNQNIRIAIIPAGSILVGYASDKSDVDYFIHILTGLPEEKLVNASKAKQIFDRANKLLQEEGFRAEVLDMLLDLGGHELVRNMSSVTMGPVEDAFLFDVSLAELFTPAVYGDGQLLEQTRRNIIKYLATIPGSALPNWEEIRKAYAESVEIALKKIADKPHLFSWLVRQGIDWGDLYAAIWSVSETERSRGLLVLSAFNRARLEQVGLPNFSEMASIYLNTPPVSQPLADLNGSSPLETEEPRASSPLTEREEREFNLYLEKGIITLADKGGYLVNLDWPEDHPRYGPFFRDNKKIALRDARLAAIFSPLIFPLKQLNLEDFGQLYEYLRVLRKAQGTESIFPAEDLIRIIKGIRDIEPTEEDFARITGDSNTPAEGLKDTVKELLQKDRGRASSPLSDEGRRASSPAEDKTEPSPITYVGSSPLYRKLDIVEAKILSEIDAAEYHKKETRKTRIAAYEDFIRAKAKQLGISMRREPLNFADYLKNLAQVDSVMKLGKNILSFLFDTYPPFAEMTYNQDRVLEEVRYYPNPKISFIVFTICITALIFSSSQSVIFAAAFFLLFLKITALPAILFFRGSYGHELTHVYQSLMVEQIRQELNLVIPKELSRLKIFELPIIRIQSDVPSPEKLKEVTKVIIEHLRKQMSKIDFNDKNETGIATNTGSSPILSANTVMLPEEVSSIKPASIPFLDRTPGGIDFRSLPIVTQAVTNLSGMLRDSPLRGQALLEVNLNEEWQQIERMASSGITPSSERIKEYIQTSCAQDSITQDRDKILLCISNILRLEEERCDSTDATLRDILVVLESMRNAQELRQVFLGTIS